MASYSGLFDGVYRTPWSLIGQRTSAHREISKRFQRDEMLQDAALATALNGVAPGATATASVREVTPVQANGMNQGGVRPIASRAVINRVTTAADVTSLAALYAGKFSVTAPYPVDKARVSNLGGGGGGKTNRL